MTVADHTITIRDPLWNAIAVEPAAVRIVDSAAFQRLRYIKQLGLAHLVYPGATHTRFDHALGVYHLARRALEALAERGGLDDVDPVEMRVVPLAALLHDVGHYPYSHALEELEEPALPGHHETLTGRFLDDRDVAAALAEVAPDGRAHVEALIRGRSGFALQGLVSGPLDLDKIEYLKRDARFCGVPYGEVDVDRLLFALTLVEAPDTGRLEIGVHEKGVAALESLLFAKYQMFRNVYWHHAVRAATVLYKRIVVDALEAGLLAADEVVGKTDEALLFLLDERGREREEDGERLAGRVRGMVSALRRRVLPKRAVEVPAALIGERTAAWLASDSPLKRRVEERLADELNLGAGCVFLDYPEKPAMFGLDLLVRLRYGQAIRLGPAGREGLIGLPRVADELYRTARVLRLFTFGERRALSADALAALARRSTEEIGERLEAGVALLG